MFPFEDTNNDPLDLLRINRGNDPLDALRMGASRNDPLDTLRHSGSDPKRLTPEMKLNLLENQLLAQRGPRNFFIEGISNIPHHAGEILHGLSKAAGLVVRGSTNVPRLAWNHAVGDKEDVQAIQEEFKAAFSAIPEIAESELDRIKQTYGSVEGFKESFRERPLDLIFDIAALADIAAAPVRVLAGRAGARASMGVDELTQLGLIESLDPRRLPRQPLKAGEEVVPPLAMEDRVVNLLKGAEDETLDTIESLTGELSSPGKRAAFLTTATDKTLQNLSVQERLAHAKHLEMILTDQGIPDLLQSATVLDKTVESIRLGNPFRLAYHTIGVMPGGRQFLERLAGGREAAKFVALMDRNVEILADDFIRTGKTSLANFTELPTGSKERVLHSVQSLADDVDLTAAEVAARQELVNLGQYAQQKLTKILQRSKHPDPEGLLSRRVMSNAITGEALFRAARKSGQLSPMETKVYNELRKLNRSDFMVKNVGRMEKKSMSLADDRGKLLKELQDAVKDQGEIDLGDVKVRTRELPEVIMEKIKVIDSNLNEVNFRIGLVKTAERRFREGQIGFIPGQRRFPDVTFLDDPAKPSGFLGSLEKRLTEVNQDRFAHLNRKRNIVTDPLAVEPLYIRYMDALARFHGQVKISDNLRAISTRVSEHDYVTMMKKMEVQGEKIHGYSLVKLSDGTVLNVPEGMKRVYESALKRTPGDPGTRPFLRVLDFTRGEFTKNVLAMNPRWLTYNVLGGGMLYTLAGGSPRALAKAIKFQTASILEGTDWIKGHPSLGKMVSKLAEEYREMVPVSQVSGFTSPQAREFRRLEHVTQDMQHFGDTSALRLPVELAKAVGKGDAKLAAEAYAQITQNIADLPRKITGGRFPTITELNEIAEEVWRSATYLSAGQQQIFARSFAKTGHLSWSLNSPEMRASFAKMSYELSPDRVLESGGLRLSADTKATLDLTNKFMNDYYRMGPIERKILRRLVPFYSWMKFTNKLAIQLPFDHPIRMSIAAHTAVAIQDAKTNDSDHLPDWMQDMVKIKDNPDGTTTFQSGRGANPFIGILLGEEGLKSTVAGINPVLLVPIQWSVGFDMFRQGPYRVAPERAGRQGIVRTFGGREAFKLTGRGLEETTPRPDPIIALARGGLLSVPFWRSFEKWARGGPHDDIGTIAELAMELGAIATGGPRVYPGAFIDDITGKPFGQGEQPTGATFLQGFGINVQNIKTKGLIERQLENELDALTKITKALEEERINALRKNKP